MKHSLLLFISLISFLGCRTPGFAPTGTTQDKYEGIVKVYFEEPDVEYEEIGILSENYEYMANDADVILRIQKKAASKGANAVIIVDIRDNPPSFHDNKGLSKMTVKAIKIINS